MWVKGTGLRCVLVEYVTSEYYTKFHNPTIIGLEKHTLVFYSK